MGSYGTLVAIWPCEILAWHSTTSYHMQSVNVVETKTEKLRNNIEQR